MRVQSQNIRATPLMRQRLVKQDVKAVKEESCLVLWQEIFPQRYRRAIRKGRGWDHFMGPNLGGCPISWKENAFKLLEKGSVKLHDSLDLPGGWNERKIVWVLLECKNTGLPVWVNNAHYVTDAFGPQNQPHRKIRREYWEAGNKTHRALIREWARTGVACIGGGDYNVNFEAPVGLRVDRRPIRYYGEFGGPDYVWSINGEDSKFTVLDVQLRRKRNTDHAGRLVSLDLTEKNVWGNCNG